MRIGAKQIDKKYRPSTAFTADMGRNSLLSGNFSESKQNYPIIHFVV